MHRFHRWLLAGLVCLRAEAFELSFPTDNDALLRSDNAAFYQPTVEGSVESGMFGCTRRDGRRFHEGADIRYLRRDKRGESLDEVRAVADGTVAFFNAKPGLSNYGRYVVLAHNWDGVEVFTLYAHLAEVAGDLKLGEAVRRGQRIGTLGRSTNTREGIPKERAHLHFEVDMLMNTRFDPWYRKQDPKAPPFGNFNGQNLYGVNPSEILRLGTDPKKKTNFAEYVARLPVGFTVLVEARALSWIERHPEQVQRAADAAAPVVAYEIGATAWGTPVAVWPRAAGELTEAQRRSVERRLPVVARVNAKALEQSGCRGLVRQGKHGWELSDHGREWCGLLTFAP